MKLIFNKGFTLIELLVVISIIGVLIGLSIFGLQGARESARDSQRKSDLELIRSGLEIYKSDCLEYPATITFSSPLTGTEAPPSACSTGNTYISQIPNDPQAPARVYDYASTGTTYTICASLEHISGAGGVVGCGSCVETCNYKVTNP
jgi:general secretion pathway protein G